MGAIYNRANRLDIGAKDPLRLVVRMADIVAGLVLFLTELTSKGHSGTPSKSVDPNLSGGDATTAD